MGAVAGEPRWRWSATSELAGNRWEILGASAPALSGFAAGFQLAATGQLSGATYDPADAANVVLSWMPQGIGSAYVSGAANDVTSDAVILFSQDPPTISGFAASAAVQALSTGYQCDGSTPCCAASGLAYTALTWAPQSSLPTSGFGAYELQRFDGRTADWATIMLATSPAVSGFNDYEARVGEVSAYRIRVVNVLNFYGAWSDQVSGSPPAPGVLMSCDQANDGVLIFTANEDQAGTLNAAYMMTWTRDPTEPFTLPEADDVLLQRMYDRDGAVAFHGTERGLEAFTRDVLIRSVAVDPLVLANAETIRDLAWDTAEYVCVRDNRGNRWFANVRIPAVVSEAAGESLNGAVVIVELTKTPTQVDP